MAPPTFGTSTALAKEFTPPEVTPETQCKRDGGFWDAERQVCLKVPKKDVPKEPPKVDATGIETFRDVKTGEPSGVTLPDGKTFLGLTPEEIQEFIQKQEAKKARLAGAAPVGTAQKLSDIQFRGEQLAGGVGQFGQLPVSPTGLDVGEAATVGIVGAIPRALSLAAGGAALGAIAGTAVLPGIGTAGGAIIGAVGGFVSGFASSMISNFKSQRSDTTTAQQRILDEGKQTMKDWATLAKNDPANKAFYLAEYNKQSAQINQAYRQMKLDTSRDLAKFETALPNLAEFESFYSAGGERDTLDIEMRNALVAQAPEGYDMLELAYRRREK